MNALIFVLFAIVLALIIFLFCKLAALSSHYDDLMDKVFKQEKEFNLEKKLITEHQQEIANIKKNTTFVVCSLL